MCSLNPTWTHCALCKLWPEDPYQSQHFFSLKWFQVFLSSWEVLFTGHDSLSLGDGLLHKANSVQMGSRLGSNRHSNGKEKWSHTETSLTSTQTPLQRASRREALQDWLSLASLTGHELPVPPPSLCRKTTILSLAFSGFLNPAHDQLTPH